MGTRIRREALSFILFAYINLRHFSNADSQVGNVALLTKHIGKEIHEEEKGGNKNWNRGTNERNREMKSGKDYKSWKKSKKWKGYHHGYYESSYYTTAHHPPTRRPVLSPTFAFAPVEEWSYDLPDPTNKPISHYDPARLNDYNSYSDMIDNYYIRYGEHSDSIDGITQPHPMQPTLPSIWSYSEDEDSESPTNLPTASPSLSPMVSLAPSMDQCMISVMLDQCSLLLQTIEPTEECDCYNFCGGIYLGCCATNDVCPLTCDVPGGFVAGCRFGFTSAPSSTHPSQVPSARPSNQQTEEPSHVPSARSSNQPTQVPSHLPSANSSNQPTEESSQTFTSTSTDTSEPFPADEPSASPTRLAAPPGENTTTTMPSTSPTRLATPPGDNTTTTIPPSDDIAIPLEPYTLEYEITYTRPTARSDIVMLTSITNSYLQEYIAGAFQSDSVILVDFVTEDSSFLEDPESSVILVTFRSTAFFDSDTQELPSRIDLEREVASAFQQSALNAYLGRTQALPASNVFSTTSQIFEVQNPLTFSTLGSTSSSKTSQAIMIRNPPIESSIKSKEFSRVAPATAVSAVLIVMSLAGFSWYRTRRKRRRIEASDKFLRRTIEIGSSKELDVKECNDEDVVSNRSEKRTSLTLLEQIERIEDMHCSFKDATNDRNDTFHGSISHQSGFDDGEDSLFEDDTIENDGDEDDSLQEIYCDNFVENEATDLYENQRSNIGDMYDINRYINRSGRK